MEVREHEWKETIKERSVLLSQYTSKRYSSELNAHKVKDHSGDQRSNGGKECDNNVEMDGIIG